VDERHARGDGGVVHGELGVDRVGPVDHQVEVGDEVPVVGGEAVPVRLRADARRDLPQSGPGHLDLGAADVHVRVEQLAVQVRDLDHVRVDETEGADARPGKGRGGRRAETADAHDENAGACEAGRCGCERHGQQKTPSPDTEKGLTSVRSLSFTRPPRGSIGCRN
jgi:hypothetical protein